MTEALHTSGLPPAPGARQRVQACGTAQMPAWDHALWQVMGGLRSSRIGEAPFFGRALFQQAGEVKLCELMSSPVAVERDAASARREDRGFIKIAVQLAGQSSFSQGGREVRLEGAGWTFYDTARPYRVVNFTEVHQFVLLVPKAGLHLPAAALDRLGTRLFNGDAGVGAVFPSYVRSIMAAGEAVSADEAATLGDVATNLLRLCIEAAGRDSKPVSAQETLEFQVRHYIKTHLADPELSVQQIATRFCCSKRHLHRVFAGGDVSLAELIWQSRLEACAQALRAPSLQHLSLSELAFRHGFNNVSHFSRAFRQHFGCTPSLYRQPRH